MRTDARQPWEGNGGLGAMQRGCPEGGAPATKRRGGSTASNFMAAIGTQLHQPGCMHGKNTIALEWPEGRCQALPQPASLLSAWLFWQRPGRRDLGLQTHAASLLRPRRVREVLGWVRLPAAGCAAGANTGSAGMAGSAGTAGTVVVLLLITTGMAVVVVVVVVAMGAAVPAVVAAGASTDRMGRVLGPRPPLRAVGLVGAAEAVGAGEGAGPAACLVAMARLAAVLAAAGEGPGRDG